MVTDGTLSQPFPRGAGRVFPEAPYLLDRAEIRDWWQVDEQASDTIVRRARVTLGARRPAEDLDPPLGAAVS